MQKFFEVLSRARNELPRTLRAGSKKLLENAPDQENIPAMLLFGGLSLLLDGAAWTVENGAEKYENIVESVQEKSTELKNTLDALKLIQPDNLYAELCHAIASFQETGQFEARLVDRDDDYSYRSWCLDFQDQRLLINITNPEDGLRISIHSGKRTPHPEDEEKWASTELMFDDLTYTTYTLSGKRLNPKMPIFKQITVKKTFRVAGHEGNEETMTPKDWLQSLNSIMPIELATQLSMFK